ncbi:GNAT family N-acetyltransferase [Armatimonas sp.]|uniref:GNAT family N-acetyltransferase n=1 Tax=Armatimonas sp. TaxID=1872638 RepID=UPI003752BECC
MQALLSRLSFRRPRKDTPLPAIELIGERVVLRPVELSDAQDMFVFVADPKVVHFLPWQPASELRGVQAFLDQQRERRRSGESLAFSIVWKATSIVIGSTDIMQLLARDRHVELGYILAQEFWSRGIMTEAAVLSRDYVFQELKRQKLVAFADHENTGSRRVLEKIGMSEIGSEWRTIKERNRLYVRYELTREAWEKLVH